MQSQPAILLPTWFVTLTPFELVSRSSFLEQAWILGRTAFYARKTSSSSKLIGTGSS